ncbi:MAG TPA: hypothetical protein VNJ49_04880 [Bradyrhizobium sp.]|nr:hypothetical protein [Bradyrhizobium sp.]
MALKFSLVRPADAAKKNGFYGFSWSTLLFGPFTALARRDFGGTLALMLVGITACAVLFLIEQNVPLLVVRLAVVNVGFALLYNEMHALRLLESGFEFEGHDSLVSALQAKLPVEGRARRIDHLRERTLFFVIGGLACIQVIAQGLPALQRWSTENRPTEQKLPAPAKLPPSEITPTLPAAQDMRVAAASPTPAPTAIASPTPAASPPPVASAPPPAAASPPREAAAAPSPLPPRTSDAAPAAAPTASRRSERPHAEMLAEWQRQCDAAMATQFDTDVPDGVAFVADSGKLSDTEISNAIRACEGARTGPGRRFNTQLGRAYAARAVRLASPEHDAEARDLMNKAITQWNAAASQESGAAMNFLGAVYKGSFNLSNFVFMQPDYPAALRWWLKGDGAGNIKATRNAAGLLLLGPADFQGITQDLPKARDLLKKAIQGGDMTAASLYGQALFYNYPVGITAGVSNAASEGLFLLRQACSKGDPQAASFFTTEMAKTRKSILIPATRPDGC